MCDGLKYVMKSSVTPPRISSIKALLKQINASARLFRGGWYYVLQDKSTCINTIHLENLNNYNFSSFAKSILNRFLPCFPANCMSRNSVSFAISLLRTTPSPNLSCRTRSPALYCCTLGSAGSGGWDICSLCDSG